MEHIEYDPPRFKTEQEIISAKTPWDLNRKMKEKIEEGWEPVGSHTAVALHSQLRYAGKQHVETEHKALYSQTMMRRVRKENKEEGNPKGED